MKAKFVVRTIKSSWRPPFNKEVTEEVFEASEGESFDKIEGNGNSASVYTLTKLAGEKAIITYSRFFTLKGPNPGNNQIILEKNNPVEMTYMWGEDGITKKITYTGV